MTTEKAAPPTATDVANHLPSANEPPGSNIGSGDAGPPEAQVAPVIEELVPDGCAIGDASFTLDVSGTGFTANSVIVFAGHDEPTTWNEQDGTVSTGVNMDVWHGPDTVPVQVRNGMARSNTLDFTFAEAGSGALASDAELGRMTRAELDNLASDRDVDVSHASNKDEVIELLRKDERKRKRKEKK